MLVAEALGGRSVFAVFERVRLAIGFATSSELALFASSAFFFRAAASAWSFDIFGGASGFPPNKPRGYNGSMKVVCLSSGTFNHRISFQKSFMLKCLSQLIGGMARSSSIYCGTGKVLSAAVLNGTIGGGDAPPKTPALLLWPSAADSRPCHGMCVSCNREK